MTLHPGFIRGGVGPLGAAAKAAEPWWLAGGISASACVAAYQPKGAASYAASKVNLANPGTYDATDGASYPSWAADTGWSFLIASSTYLNTGVVPVVTGLDWSMIVRYSGATSTQQYQALCGRCVSDRYFLMYQKAYLRNEYRHGNGAIEIGSPTQTGVNCIAGSTAYKNGGFVATIPATVGASNPYSIYIGAQSSAGTANAFFTGNILAFAIYNATLSAAQVAALTTAMNAL